MLVRCPKCGKEVYMLAAARDYCNWCGYEKQKEDKVFYLKKYTYTGPGELDTRVMLGLYHVIESVISSSPYLLNVEEEL